MSSLEDPRVLFAAERTLLAWNRTSLGLIAFGFLVERAGLLQVPGMAPAAAPDALTFWIGLAFVAVGVVAAIFSSQQYATVLRTLTPAEFPRGYNPRWGMWINHLVALLGACLIVGLALSR